MEIVWKIISFIGLLNFLRIILFTDYTKWDDTPASLKEPKANLELRPILKYYYILKMDPNVELSLEAINKAYINQIQENEKIKERGFTPIHDLNEIERAKQVLMDFYKYAAFRN